jgi:hypothetical protein
VKRLNTIWGGKMELENEYWLVVYCQETGEFKIAFWKNKSNNFEELSAQFEMKNPDYRAIHVGEGNLPPKTYRSLEIIY